MTRNEFLGLVGADYVDEYDKTQLSQEGTTKDATSSTAGTISRQFKKIVVSYPPVDLCNYPEYKGKPYFSIHYKENGEGFIGYGTYNPEVLSQYLRDYFMPPAQPEERTKSHAETHACDLITKIQNGIKATDANDVYSCGMRNGMRWCISLIDDKDPLYENCPPAHPEEAIPVAWISAQIKRLKGMDNLFADLTADIIQTTLNEWRKELEGETT